MIRLAINGATGRMGRRLVALSRADASFDLVSATCSEKSTNLNQDAGELAGIGPIGLATRSRIEKNPQVVIDFSSPAGAVYAVEYCLTNEIPLMLATTGMDKSFESQVIETSKKIPVCFAANTSLAVNLTMKLAQIAAKALGKQSSQVDVEIIERHHRFKADAPSGTALKFGKLIADAMGQETHRHGRQGETGQRPKSEIGYHAVRAGDDAGQHTILFALLGELIELRVAASNRDCYALGALAAAKFLVNRNPGMWSMNDVLGIDV